MKTIVIVGAGFAGLAAAKELRHAYAEVFVVDRANHNLYRSALLPPEAKSARSWPIKSCTLMRTRNCLSSHQRVVSKALACWLLTEV
jgi:NADH dehydrogenase FAD-containing subunit